jgi:hypothetical protein
MADDHRGPVSSWRSGVSQPRDRKLDEDRREIAKIRYPYRAMLILRLACTQKERYIPSPRANAPLVKKRDHQGPEQSDAADQWHSLSIHI